MCVCVCVCVCVVCEEEDFKGFLRFLYPLNTLRDQLTWLWGLARLLLGQEIQVGVDIAGWD